MGDNGASSSGDDVLDDEERAHFASIVHVFASYERWALGDVARRCAAVGRLPPVHRDALRAAYEQHAMRLRQCIQANAKLLQCVIEHVQGMFVNVAEQQEDERRVVAGASEFNMEKLRSTLREITRDWSAEGADERSQSMGKVLSAFVARFGHVPADGRRSVRVCVPGAGLARLAWDVAKLGYSCQANECSLFMLFVANFVLNRLVGVGASVVYPWAHQHSNVYSYEDMCRPVAFPDVDTSDLPDTPAGCEPLFSMAAGDFLQVYASERQCFDAVLTVFFLDTAKNPLQYIDCIQRILVDGGYWINFGPLLYHYADVGDTDAIELPYEEVRRQIAAAGFHFEKETVDVPACYARNARSMLQYSYRCAYFVCRKAGTRGGQSANCHTALATS